MSDTVLMVWDSSKGGRDRAKAVPSHRVTEYISYGWSLQSVAPEPIPAPLSESAPILPTLTESEMALVIESTKPEPRKRGRPAKR